MRLNYLSLTNFRNYARLELRLAGRLTVIQGANAQGKTNLLEAIHLLATGRSPRAVTERELIGWLALESALPYARFEAEIGEGKRSQKLELVLELARTAGTGGSNGPGVRKQVRINGVPKRALDLVGRLRVVLFLPEDVSLVAGAPAERRRYLDIALCQIAPAYCRALSEYNKVLTQRNALLKRLRDEGGDGRQLGFWNSRAAEHGSLLIHQRLLAIRDLDRLAAERQAELTAGREALHLAYLPGIDLNAPARGGNATGPRRKLSEIPEAYLALSLEEIQARFLAQLHHIQAREIAAGTCLAGPHRDDMSFSVDGHDLRAFGSRGQQRTSALALKLAEVQLMQTATGESPLLLLDDVMSELDIHRRQTLLGALASVTQAVVTTTDWTDFSPELLEQAQTLHVTSGVLSPADEIGHS
jgi:DNA replication and repair protein RecF